MTIILLFSVEKKKRENWANLCELLPCLPCHSNNNTTGSRKSCELFLAPQAEHGCVLGRSWPWPLKRGCKLERHFCDFNVTGVTRKSYIGSGGTNLWSCVPLVPSPFNQHKEGSSTEQKASNQVELMKTTFVSACVRACVRVCRRCRTRTPTLRMRQRLVEWRRVSWVAHTHLFVSYPL